MKIQLGDYVRRFDKFDATPQLVVDMPHKLDQRPEFKGKMLLFKAKQWVHVEDYVIVDERYTKLRRAIRDVLIREDYKWPEDERIAYGEHGWQPGIEAANAIRIEKILAAVREHLI